MSRFIRLSAVSRHVLEQSTRVLNHQPHFPTLPHALATRHLNQAGCIISPVGITFQRWLHVSTVCRDDDEDDLGPGTLAYEWRKRRQREVQVDSKTSARRGDRSLEALAKQEQTEMSLDPEVLYQQIRGMGVSELLDSVEVNHDKLDLLHFPVALRRLNQLRRQQSTTTRDAFVQEVAGDAGFQILCAYLAKHGPAYEADVCCDMLVFLANFHLDSNHLAVQVFIELLKHHINQLTLDQMMQAGSAVSEMKPSKQTRLLMAAIEALAPSRENDLPVLELWERICLLDMCGGRLGDTMRSQLLVDIQQDVHMIGWKYALTLFRGLVNSGCSQPVLENQCVDQFVSQHEKLSVGEMLEVTELAVRHSLYCPDLYPLVAARLIEEGCDIKLKLKALMRFREQSFVHRDLLTSVLDELSRQTQLSDWLASGHLTLADLHAILRCLADAHMTLNKMAATGALHNITDVFRGALDDMDPVSLLWVCLNLEVLHCEVPREMMEKLLTDECVQPLIELDKHNQQPGMLSMLDKLLVLSSQPDYVSSRPHHRGEQLTVALSDLQGAVEKAVGGKEYVQHLVTTPTGIMIAHVVEMDPSGNKLRVGDQEARNHLKEDEIQKVAVMVQKGKMFNRNTGQMKGPTHLYARTLQKQGYSVIVINLASYEKISEKGRIDYLAYKINNADKFSDLVMVGMDNL